MNIYEMHTLFDQLLDEVATTRIDIPEFLRLARMATNDIVDSRIDPIKNPQNRQIYLQSAQRVREELRTLVKEDGSISITNDILAVPTDYKHYLLLKLYVDGTLQTAKPVTFDWLGANEENPHIKPSPTRPKFVEKNAGIELYVDGGTITAGSSRFEYIAQPAELAWDETAITAGTLTNGTEYVVTLVGGLVQSGVTYNVGDTVIGDGTAVTWNGATVNDVTSSDLPVYLHDEIVRKTVDIQLTVMQEPNRKQLVQVDETQS